jgi:hypothetical protein
MSTHVGERSRIQRYGPWDNKRNKGRINNKGARWVMVRKEKKNAEKATYVG